MKLLRLIGLMVIAVVIFFGLFLTYASITYYNPEKDLVVEKYVDPDTLSVDSTYDALIWNIGYAGLGDNMDFFYDEGEKVRDTKERTQQNLDSIGALIHQNSKREFILLQEVDVDSKRTYHINQLEYFQEILKRVVALGINYKVNFVPIPPREPMGMVYSGIATFSTYKPVDSRRYAYPGQFDWPVRLFNLRRCMLVNRYPLNNNRNLLIINTHKSAFDDGSLKKLEMDFLKEYILSEYLKGNYVIVGGDWNQSPPGFKLNTFGDNYEVDFFKMTNIDSTFIDPEWKWVFDSTTPTNRYLSTVYKPGETYCSILDFYLTSPNIEVLTCKTYHQNFRWSDHNPVAISFKLKN